MSLETAIEENTKALNHLLAVLNEIKATIRAPQKSAPPAASAPAETVSDVPPSSEPTEQTQAGAEPVEVTPADLRKQVSAEVVRLCKAGAEQKKQAAAVLKEFGAAQVPQIKDDDLVAALGKLKAL